MHGEKREKRERGKGERVNFKILNQVVTPNIN